jgi:DNA repair exonuclease SbcCD ATPase subunit
MNAATDFDTVSDQMFSLDEDDLGIPPMNEDFDGKVQQAQEQLVKLRHQQDQIEKQKTELEELGKQQDRFIDGRTALCERLHRAISTLDREAQEAERRSEEFLEAKDSFTRHLERIRCFNPEQWSRTDLSGELCRALSAIEDAESDYKNSMTRLAGLLERNSAAGSADASSLLNGLTGQRSFKHWFLGGLAFTLPFMAFSILAFVLYLILV